MTYKKQSGSTNQEVCKSATAIAETILESIVTDRIHKLADLERSTAMFGRLAESNGNAMAQILYGLALRFAPTISRL